MTLTVNVYNRIVAFILCHCLLPFPLLFQVNGNRYPFNDVGVFTVVVDACGGTVAEKKLFPQTDVKRVEEYLKTGIPQRYITVNLFIYLQNVW